jgi:hypothetical protein
MLGIFEFRHIYISVILRMKYMLKKKKDAELSITIIIVAILGLIVLGIMVAIFSTESGDAVKTLKTCAAKGGDCRPSNEECTGRVLTSVECGGSCGPDPCTIVCCLEI